MSHVETGGIRLMMRLSACALGCVMRVMGFALPVGLVVHMPRCMHHEPAAGEAGFDE